MEQHTGKYRALWSWLVARTDNDVQLGFAAIEQILGFSLPPSSRNHLAHWYSYGGSAVGRAIRDAGWRAASVNLTAESVHFRREQLRPTEVELADELGRRGVDDRIAGLVLAYAANHSVEFTNSDRKYDVALAASYDAYAAVFVSPSSLSIALDPDEARRASGETGLHLRESTPTTSHLIVSMGDLDGVSTEGPVSALIASAFERSDQGPRWNRGLPDRTITHGRVCPSCFLEMPLSGICPNCS